MNSERALFRGPVRTLNNISRTKYQPKEGSLLFDLLMSAANQAGISTLEKLCQQILADEAVKHGSKKINELCKRIPSHLLESILESLLDRNQVTDVALNMFLVPSRTKLVMNGFCKIKNSTLKQIGYSCPNLVSFSSSTRYPPRCPNFRN